MSAQIVLLRAVNVGGRGKLAMADLRQCAETLGFSGARTLLQSGNLVCDGGGEGPRGVVLEERLEAELLRQLGLRTDVIARTADEWGHLVAGNPFADEAAHDPSHLMAVLAKRPVRAGAADALRAAATALGGREAVGEAADAGRGQLYLTFPDGIGRSRLTTAAIERALGVPVTSRNWNTVVKLAAMAKA